MAQIEFARDVIFRRRARLHELFQRAVEIGVALGGATQTRHLFGRRINCRYQGKLETILERRDEGFPVLRGYYKSSYVKQYEKGDRLLRTETCLNDTYHLAIGRKLDNLPAIKKHLAATTDRYLTQQAELLDSTVDRGRVGGAGGAGDHRRRAASPASSCMTTASSECSTASYTPVACSGIGRRGNCTHASWLGTVSARTTTPSASSDTTSASCAPMVWSSASAAVGAIDSPRTVCGSARCSSKSARVCSARSSPTRPSLPSRAATTPAPW